MKVTFACWNYTFRFANPSYSKKEAKVLPNKLFLRRVTKEMQTIGLQIYSYTNFFDIKMNIREEFLLD